MVLYQSEFVEIIYEAQNSLIIDKFLSNSENMEDEDFKKDMMAFVELCEKHKPSRELVHLLEMRYTIAPAMQQWMNTVIFPHYENIIKRMAFLVPTELIAQLSVEQTMEEEAGQKFLQKYFDSEADARSWLLKE